MMPLGGVMVAPHHIMNAMPNGISPLLAKPVSLFLQEQQERWVIGSKCDVAVLCLNYYCIFPSVSEGCGVVVFVFPDHQWNSLKDGCCPKGDLGMKNTQLV